MKFIAARLFLFLAPTMVIACDEKMIGGADEYQRRLAGAVKMHRRVIRRFKRTLCLVKILAMRCVSSLRSGFVGSYGWGGYA